MISTSHSAPPADSPPAHVIVLSSNFATSDNFQGLAFVKDLDTEFRIYDLPTKDYNCGACGIYGRHITREEVVKDLLSASDNKHIRMLMAHDILSLIVSGKKILGELKRRRISLFNTLVESYQEANGSEKTQKRILSQLQAIDIFKDYVTYFIGGRIDDDPKNTYNMLTHERGDGKGAIAALAALKGVSLNIYQEIEQIEDIKILKQVFSYQCPDADSQVISLLHMSQDPTNPANLNHFQLLVPISMKLLGENKAKAKDHATSTSTVLLPIYDIDSQKFGKGKTETSNKSTNPGGLTRHSFNSLSEEKKKEAKYEYYYDDSSSDEEDTKSLKEKGLDDLDSKIKNLKKRIASEEVDILNFKLSFLAHEFGIRILKSPEVSDYYYDLKLKNLERIRSHSDEEIETYIQQAIKYAFQNIYGDNKRLLENFISKNKEVIEKIVAQAKEDKRAFIKAVFRKNLKQLISNFENTFQSFPAVESSKITLESLVEEIYADIDIENDGTINELKLVHERLEKYTSVSPVKEKLVENLKDSPVKRGKNPAIATFIRDNCDDDLYVEEHEKQYSFIDYLPAAFIRAFGKYAVIRSTLPNLHIITFEGNYTPAHFLAYIRLITASNIRLMKNNNNSFFEEEQTVFRSFRFPSSGKNEMVLEEQTIALKTKTRTDLVKNLSTYSNIYFKIKKIKENFNLQNSEITDSTIVEWIKKTLKGEDGDIFEEIRAQNNTQKVELRTFIDSLTYLLFGTEVSRNPASLLIHCMMLELIQAGSLTDSTTNKKNLRVAWSFKQAFYNKYMPMSIRKEKEKNQKGPVAVRVARWMHQNYPTTFEYSYDKTTTSVASSTDKAIITMINKEARIFKEWLALKGVELDEALPTSRESNLAKILPLLNKLSKDWYGISILSEKITNEFIDVFNKNLLQNAEEGNIEIVQALLEIPNININVCDADRRTPLMYAAWRGNIDVVKALLKSPNIKVNAVNVNKKTALIYAAIYGQAQIVKELLKVKDIQVNLKDINEMSALKWANKENRKGSHKKIIKILKEYSQKESAQDDDVSTLDSKLKRLEINKTKHETNFCPSITYTNPLLNDPQFSNLRFLAKLYFGMEGVDALIDLGADSQKYEAFSSYRQKLGDEQAIVLFLTQELEELKEPEVFSSPNLIILDPQGRELVIDNDYLQKLHLQLLHYYETGELLETARFALAAGYTYEIETEPFLSDLLGIENLEDALNEETSTSIVDSLESLFSTPEPLDNILPIPDEKLQAQQDYYLQTGVAYETLADYLQLDPVADNDDNNEEGDIIHEYNSTTNHTNAEAPSLPLLNEEDLLKLNHQSLIFPFLSSDQ